MAVQQGKLEYRKGLAWDAPQTLCQDLLMPIYTSGLLKAKPNSLLGSVLLTLSSSEPRWLLNHHLSPVRADLASLLLQGPQSHHHVAGNVSAMPSREHNTFHGEPPAGFRTPDQPTKSRAVTKRHPLLCHHSICLLLGTFFFFSGLVSLSYSL